MSKNHDTLIASASVAVFTLIAGAALPYVDNAVEHLQNYSANHAAKTFNNSASPQETPVLKVREVPPQDKQPDNSWVAPTILLMTAG